MYFLSALMTNNTSFENFIKKLFHSGSVASLKYHDLKDIVEVTFVVAVFDIN